jgi:hypothetical protein
MREKNTDESLDILVVGESYCIQKLPDSELTGYGIYFMHFLL